MVGNDIDTIKKNTETLIDTSNEVVLEIKKNKCMLVSCHQNGVKNWQIKTANNSFENVSQFKSFAMTVLNKNLIQEEIKRRFSSGNACYHSVQDLLFSHLSRDIKIRMYTTIVLRMVLYGYETLSLT
jgi:hypothetical protein